MELYGITKDKIKRHSVVVGDNYAFPLGDDFEVSTTQKSNKNRLIAYYTHLQKMEDSFMIKYHPSNVVFFKKGIIDSDNQHSLKRVSIQLKDGYVYIGDLKDFPIKYGVLVMSGKLSANNLVEKDTNILFNSQLTVENSTDKIKLLSVGLLKDDFYGIIYVPKERGFIIEDIDNPYVYYSVKTWKPRKKINEENWTKLNIRDWFNSCNITVIED